MRLCVVVPITNLTTENLNDRTQLLKGMARADTEIEMWPISEGPVTIESRYEEELAAAPVLKLVRRAAGEGFDAIGVWCGGDPAVGAAREIVDIPVVGPGQSSLALAHMLGRRYSIISPRAEEAGIFEELADRTGYARRLLSIEGAGLTVLQLREDKRRTLECLLKAGQKAIEGGAQVLVLGCLGMVGYSHQMSERLGVPVVDPARALVAVAELLVHYGLTFSRLTYPAPKDL